MLYNSGYAISKAFELVVCRRKQPEESLHDSNKSEQKIEIDVQKKEVVSSIRKPFRLKLNYDEDSGDSDVSDKNQVSLNPNPTNSSSAKKKDHDGFDDFFDT